MRKLSDPTRLEVFYNAISGVSDAMALTVVRTSRSSVVRLGYDFSTGILHPRGELVGQGLCQPIHMGGMPPALAACLGRYKGNVNPGDVLVNNDPYEGGSHLPDLFMFKPVFAGERLVAFACAMSHHTDMGGRVAGSNASDSSEIYQEGLRIPPLKLFEKGRPNQTLFRMIEKAVRVPDTVLGDLRGQVAAVRLGEIELLGLARRYGVEEFVALQDELLDHTERLTRLGIARLPEGTWSFTDHIDDDGFGIGPVEIVTNLTKAGDSLSIDFSGTSPQVKGAINVPLDAAKSMVYAVVRTVLGGDIPNTGGYFRPVSVRAPEGCFVNPLPPAAVAARYLGCLRVSQSVFGAFARMLPEAVPACPGGCDSLVTMAGYHVRGNSRKAWVQVEGANEIASGGMAGRDGCDAQSSPISNITNIPAELIEADHPIRVEEYALIPDSEGAGRFRGGVGIVREYGFLHDDTVVQLRSDRMKHPPYGLCGGQPGRAARVTLVKASAERIVSPSKFIVSASRGDRVRIEMPGGGGWGDPIERAPERVLADVIAEKVSPERAERVYGVVVRGREVDHAATERLRAARRATGRDGAPGHAVT